MLNDDERAKVKAAVRAAEGRTRGELYCVIAAESSDYRETPFLWAGLAALDWPFGGADDRARFDSWDVPSTVWLRWAFDRARELVADTREEGARSPAQTP